MSAVRFVRTQALRELRATPRRLLVLVAAIAIGVGALTAIGSFTDNLQRSVSQQAKALLGADLVFTSRKPIEQTAVAPSVEAVPGEQSTAVEFAAMAYAPAGTTSRLVQVVAVDPGWPWYGEIVTEPRGRWADLQSGAHILVEPTLLPQLGAQVGDSLVLGDVKLLVIGTVVQAPGDAGIRSVFGARVYLPRTELERMKLLTFGARAEYSTYVKVPTGIDAQTIADSLRPLLRPERVRVQSVSDNESNLNETLRRLGSFLGVIALVALLLGGIGVASAVTAHLRRKRESIAVLRCLGAPGWQVFAIYLFQTVVLGLAGSIAGVIAGIGIQQLLPGVLGAIMPADVEIRLSLRATLVGLGAGLWTAVAFSLPPLLAVRRVTPLAALRRDYLDARPPRDPLWPIAVVLLGASVVGLAVLQVGSLVRGLFFAGAIVAALFVLWLASLALVKLVRRFFPTRWPYVWRQGLANLYRPANQTVTVVLALGFGAFLLGTLIVVQRVLLAPLELPKGQERPNLVLLDVQPEQQTRLDESVREAGYTLSAPTPIVPMRLLSVKGVPVTQLLADSTDAASVSRDSLADPLADTAGAPPSGPPGAAGAPPAGERGPAWVYRREYRSTYRSEPGNAERITQGRWFAGPRAPSDTGASEVSVEEGVAKELGVTIGDELIWDVQGAPIVTRVTSLRKVDWARFEPNFFVIFQPGVLEQAPQTIVGLVRVDDPAARGRLQRVIAERFPNVTTVDVGEVQKTIETLVGKVALAIRFMAGFSLITGAIVLVGAIGTTREQRAREGALLKTIGATQGQVWRVLAAEYLALGACAALVANGLAMAGGWALAHFVFDQEFLIPWGGLGALAALVAGGTVVVGILSSLDVVRRPPLQVLRAE